MNKNRILQRCGGLFLLKMLAWIFHRRGAENAEKRQKQKGKERKIGESENSDRVSFVRRAAD
jgi:hypothetical protein